MNSIAIADDPKNHLFNKKLMLSAIVIALLAIMTVSLISISDDSDADNIFTVDGLNYEETSNNEVRVIKGQYSGAITIPSSVTDDNDYTYSVTAIKPYAFMTSSLTSVIIPSSVTSIGEGAFMYCYSLRSVSLNADITAICDNTFLDCRSLTDISLPAGVTHIGHRAFHCCTSLTEISLPAGVNYIGTDAFSGCKELTMVSVHNSTSVPVADSISFSPCVKLKDIYVPYTKYNDYYNSPYWSAVKDKLRPAVEVPIVNKELVYNGLEQTGVSAVSGEYALSGTTAATDVGNYTATATLVPASPSRYWFDGTPGDIYNIQWSIVKPESVIAITKDSSCVTKNFNVGATNTGDGKLSYEIISGKDIAEVSAKGDITAKSIGTVKLKITAAETDDYRAGEKIFEISINDHTHVTVPGKVPTTTETGLTEGERCSECHEILVQQEIIPKTESGHSVVETVDARAEFDVPKSGEIVTLVIKLNEELNEYTVSLDEKSTDSVEGKHIDFSVESISDDDDTYTAVMIVDSKEFNGTMYITVPYDPEKGTPSIRWIEGNEDMDIISINEDDETITFVTTHNSTYEVEYEKSFDGLILGIWAIPVVLFLILICLLIYADAKKE